MSEFRADIQGLRAIAVVGVLLFHVNPLVLSGGFVGVDVFFVISGFLITRIIWRDLCNDTFTFRDFYARRIKRLYPALVAMLIGTSVGTCFLALPDESRTFAASMLSSLVYVSNIYFLAQTDYFASDLDLNTLLHTWSLSVEEQFYLCYPLLLLIIVRNTKRQPFVVLAALLVASLVLSEALIEWHQRISFFIAPSRFFQFLAGALLALRADSAGKLPRTLLDPIAFTGLAMIIGSMAFYSGSMRFPGIAALPPTLGTALVILACQRQDLFCGKVLALPLLLFLGEISYSLYLWHWPIVTFYKVSVSPSPSYWEQLGLLAASIGAGYVSWRFVEMPFRRLKLANAWRVFKWGIVATATLTVVGVWLYTTGGLSKGFSSQQLKIAQYLTYYPERNRRGSCFLTSDFRDAQSGLSDDCIAISDSQPNVILIGDSHAAHFYSALHDLLPDVSLSQVTASGCKPTIPFAGEPRCAELLRQIIEELIPSGRFQGVIISARWQDSDTSALLKTVEQLARNQIAVFVLGPIVSYDQALPRLLSRFGSSPHLHAKIESARNYRECRDLDNAIRNQLAGTKAVYISILDSVCPNGRCMVFSRDGVPIQWDTAHLTHEGALEIVDSFRRTIMVTLNDARAANKN